MLQIGWRGGILPFNRNGLVAARCLPFGSQMISETVWQKESTRKFQVLGQDAMKENLQELEVSDDISDIKWIDAPVFVVFWILLIIVF
ncbi:MAG: hypothetical protein JRF72_07480, partial [Deltaproteobacteria bacterium]|nr:hypothetical protein [Deltaproteobacteria bacterium]